MPPDIKSFVLFLSDDFRASKLSNSYVTFTINRIQINIQARADPEGGQGVRTPLENHKLYGFL